MYELMLKQYESAKLDESRDASVIQTVENPEIPQKRYKPKRKIIVAVSTFTALFFAIIWIYLKIFIKNIKASNPVLKDKNISSFLDFKKIKSDIKTDIDKIKKILKNQF